MLNPNISEIVIDGFRRTGKSFKACVKAVDLTLMGNVVIIVCRNSVTADRNRKTVLSIISSLPQDSVKYNKGKVMFGDSVIYFLSLNGYNERVKDYYFAGIPSVIAILDLD